MKVFFTILLLCTGLLVIAQADSIGLKETMQKLDQALLQKDEPSLQKILHNNTSYGHSNGWVQTKADVFNDFKSGKLSYNKIESGNQKILAINDK